MNIHSLLDGLAGERPVFHSEADFQFALAWRIREETGQEVRLEYKPFPAERKKLAPEAGSRRRARMYLDIWLPEVETAIELKYLTRSLEWEHRGERFSILDQGAHDISRYDSLKDIQRLERVTGEGAPAWRGIAVLLTNDPLYWELPVRKGTVDAEFRLHEGRRLSGKMEWSERAGNGTTAGRRSPICLRGSYALRWRDYGAPLPERKWGRFRYLAVEVRRTP